jgi:hypothetical protein
VPLCFAAGAWQAVDHQVGWVDPRDAALDQLAARDAQLHALTSPRFEAVDLVAELQLNPELAPLVLRQALRAGALSPALTALTELTEDSRQALSGWEDRLSAEAGIQPRRQAPAPEPLRVAVGGFADLPASTDAVAPSRDATESRRLFDRVGRPLLARDSAGAPWSSVAADHLVPQVVEELLAEVSPGGALRTTLDLALARRLSNALDDAVERLESRAAGGTIVLLSARDAELLAAVTSHRGGTIGQPEGQFTHATPFGHQALLQAREPASIAKLITTAATYRSGRDANAEISSMDCNGAIRLGSEVLYCTSISGALRGLDQAMASSCNVAFAELGRRIGSQALLNEYERFGFQLSGQGSARLGFVPSTALRSRAFGDLAVGLNYVEITPLHAALLGRTLVDGRWLPARLVRAETGQRGWSSRPLSEGVVLRDPLSRSTQGPASATSSVLIEPAALVPLQRSMRAVVRRGTAAGVAPQGLQVAMKTGTGRTDHEGFHVNYIGFTGTPSQPNERDVAFSVRLVGGRSSRWVRREAKLLTSEVLRIVQDQQRVPEGLTW